MIGSLLQDCKIIKVMDSQSTGQTNPTSSIVDTQGYGGACFICKLGAVTNAAKIEMDVQGNTANATSGMADMSGAKAAIAEADSDAEQSLVVDVVKPRKRYLRVEIERDTQNSEIDSVFCILYNGQAKPATQPATIDASAQVVSPADA